MRSLLQGYLMGKFTDHGQGPMKNFSKWTDLTAWGSFHPAPFVSGYV
jgi:hypothetical protein